MKAKHFKCILLFALVIGSSVLYTSSATYGQENAIFSVSPGAFTATNVPLLGSPYIIPQNLLVWNRDNAPRTVLITTEIPPENATKPGYAPIPNENWVIPSPASILIEENSYALIQITFDIPRWENLTGQKWEVWIPVERQPLPGDSGTLKPTVRIDIETTQELPPGGVQVSVSPASKSGEPGESLNYSVTVMNTGTSTDTFNLTASDTKGWGTTLSITAATLAAGASRTGINLNITIPSTANVGAVSTITVTATGTGYENSTTCTATVTHAQENAIFSVSPGSFTARDVPPMGMPYTIPQSIVVRNGDTNARTVTITSEIPPEGQTTAGYEPIPNANWVIPSPSQIPISANSSANVQISLNIPRWENLTGKKWEVWIQVERQALSGEIGVLRPTVRMMIETTTTLYIRGVSVSISPSLQIAVNGATLTYTVTVLNTGNVSDNYSLVVSDNASPSWSPSVSPTLLTVSAGSSGNSLLRVTVPSGGANGAIDNLTVTVNGTGVSDSSSCTAQVAASVPPVFEITIIIINPGAPVTIYVENVAIPELTINVVRTAENVSIRIEETTEKPTEIAVGAPGVVCRYLEITKENITDNNISSARIKFKVEKSWIAANGINEATITLYRYDPAAGTWTGLPTTKIGEDTTYLYFQSTSPGLSELAIAGVASPAPTRWPLIAGVVMVIAVLGTAFALYLRRR